MMNIAIHFAYGSNMLTERLRKRCSSATPIGAAVVQKYRLSFCKSSTDGSGKATLIASPDDEVYGVLFKIAFDQIKTLDDAEGVDSGYDKVEDFPVIRIQDGKRFNTVTYIASKGACDLTLAPYDWYHNLVIAGADQHGLPGIYIKELRAQQSIIDPMPNRNTRLNAIKVLKSLGM